MYRHAHLAAPHYCAVAMCRTKVFMLVQMFRTRRGDGKLWHRLPQSALGTKKRVYTAVMTIVKVRVAPCDNRRPCVFCA